MIWVDKYLMLNLPPLPICFFLYFIGFFILMMTMGMKPWLSIVGSIAFAFSSFFFIVIVAGHNSEAHAIGYMAPVIASHVVGFPKKKPSRGSAHGTILSLQINANHLQITYYLALMALIIVIFQLVEKIKAKQLPDFFKAVWGIVCRCLTGIGSKYFKPLDYNGVYFIFHTWKVRINR